MKVLLGVRSSLTAILIAVGLAAPAAAQTVTAFKSGERTTGLTKQCFYNALGNTHTRTVSSVALCPLSIQVATTPRVQRAPMAPAAPRPPVTPRASATPSSPGTTTGFYTGEQVTGMTKQCFYNALGNTYVRTVSSVTVCPMNVRVPLNPAASVTAPVPPVQRTPTSPAMTVAFLTGEQTTGMTKQCYYDALGNTHTHTVSSITICPLTLRVPLRP
jgi:hypothetical protein